MASVNKICWEIGINCIGCQGSMLSGTHLETNYLTVVACTVVDYQLVGLVPLYLCYQWQRIIKYVGKQVSITSGVRNQWCQELECVGVEGHNFVW